MTKGDRVFVGVACVVFVLTLLSTWLLQPEAPNLPRQPAYKPQATNYRAGGADCEPSRINALPTRNRHLKADVCAEADEQHREASESLSAARRSAAAAEASAATSADQARVDAWNEAFGLLTLLAAIAAAWFAKKAADHTERASIEANRQANAAERSLRLTGSTTKAQLRAYVNSVRERYSEDEVSGQVKLTHAYRNVGQTPAHDLEYLSHVQFLVRNRDGGPEPRVVGTTKVRQGVVGPGAENKISGYLRLTPFEFAAIKSGNGALHNVVTITYRDEFGDRWQYRQTMQVEQKAREDGKMFTLNCYTNKPAGAEMQEAAQELPLVGGG